MLKFRFIKFEQFWLQIWVIYFGIDDLRFVQAVPWG